MKSEKKYRLGITLSGGGARGFGHIGVLKALNEYSIYPDIICGCSAGAVIGAFYADGKSPDEIFSIFKDTNGFNILRLSAFKKGLLSTEKLLKFFENHLRNKTFENLIIPFSTAVVNINTGDLEFFNNGNLPKALKASCAFPGVFEAVKINDHWYCDGGLINNMPTTPIKDKCELLIGVNVNPPLIYTPEIVGLRTLVSRIFRIYILTNTEPEISNCDVYICPPELGAFEIIEMRKSQEIYDAGYGYMRKWLEDSENENLVRKMQKATFIP